MFFLKKNSHALHILSLSLFLSLLFSIILFIVIYLFSDLIIEILGNPSLKNWLYWIPVSVTLISIYQVLTLWYNRQKNYKEMSNNRVVVSMATASSHVSFGYFLSTVGLILGNILGYVIGLFFYLKKFLKSNQSLEFNTKKILILAKRYRKFPQYDLFATLFNVVSQRSNHIFFNIFFSATVSGYYYLVQRILNLPISLIAAAIFDVFKIEITELYHTKGDIRALFIATLKKLFMYSLLPMLGIYLFAADMIVFVFGENWAISAEILYILMPMFFLRFISTPLSYMFYLKEKQHYNVIGQFILFIMIIIAFLIGCHYDYMTTITLISIFFSIFYLVYIGLSFHFTKEEIK